MSLTQRRQMSFVCLERFDQPLGHFPGLYYLNHRLNFLAAEKLDRVLFDVTRVARAHHIVRHSCLEFAISPEHHDGKDLVLFNGEEFLKHLDVTVVLMQRVLKAVFLTEQTLRPLATLRIAEDPTIHIFGLDNEYPVLRNNDVIDLGRAVIGLKRDVVEWEIGFRVEEQFVRDGTNGFTDPAFYERFEGHGLSKSKLNKRHSRLMTSTFMVSSGR